MAEIISIGARKSGLLSSADSGALNVTLTYLFPKAADPGGVLSAIGFEQVGGINVRMQTEEIEGDEIRFTPQQRDYFRYVLANSIKNLSRNSEYALQQMVTPLDYARTGFATFLRPHSAARAFEKGHTEETLVRHVQEAAFPIPREFIIMLPPAKRMLGDKMPRREEIIESLVPMRKAFKSVLRQDDESFVALSFFVHDSGQKPQQLIVN